MPCAEQKKCETSEVCLLKISEQIQWGVSANNYREKVCPLRLHFIHRFGFIESIIFEVILWDFGVPSLSLTCYRGCVLVAIPE